MVNLSKQKIILSVLSGCLALSFTLAPVVIAGAVVAAPIMLVGSLFKSIGDFVFGDGNENEILKILKVYFEQLETKKDIRKIYHPEIDAEKEISVPLHWLVIPNLLAANEEVDKAEIKLQIKCMKEKKEEKIKMADLETYINSLREENPWKEAFANVSTTTIVGYINEASKYLNNETNLDAGDLSEEDFLYPLKNKALVTSEFGKREGHGSNFHTGIDLAYAGGDAKTCGVAIYAAQSGEVKESDATSGGKNYMGDAYGAKINYMNLSLWYLHMRDPFPHAVGKKIKKGDFIGYMGTSGNSTGCHLHFEIHVNGKAANPRNFLVFD
ncbi:MAG: M23 family metallopeptidase [Breznakia sp.]